MMNDGCIGMMKIRQEEEGAIREGSGKEVIMTHSGRCRWIWRDTADNNVAYINIVLVVFP